MVQGVEAGGHNRATEPLTTVLPAAVSAVAPTPVIAAGGIADGRGLLAALDQGAQAVSLGTRFLCSDESGAAPAYKERIVQARAEDTLLTTAFDLEWPDAPHRVLHNRVTEAWEAAGSPRLPERRYSISMPMLGFEGDLNDQALYCGESCSRIDDIRPAAEIVRTVVEDAEALLRDRSAEARDG
ncbi:MAG TPA: nitronate monooxygenase, partial [Mycobacteriales bacterium]